MRTCGIGQPEPTAQDCSHECHVVPALARLWIMPVPYFLRHGWSQSLQTHIALMRDIKPKKILLGMTETASITFMTDSSLVFKTLQLALEIAFVRSCEL